LTNSNNSITIRELTRLDIPQLQELAVRIYRDTFTHQNSASDMEAFLRKDYSTDSFEREFGEDGSRYYFACDGDVPVAYLRLRYNGEAEDHLGKNTLELHRLYVDTAYQGRNIGNQLMEFAIEQARELGVDWLWLGVWEHNPKAHRFYERWGFVRFADHVFQMGDDAQTDWLLKKRIL
jgi:ribosomal protein S18 acetylase RimI-like enzyme